MKKFLCAFLVLMMVLALFAGCTTGKNPPPDSMSSKDSSSSKDDMPDDSGGDDEAPVPIVLFRADNNVPEYPLNMERPNMQRIHDVLLEKFNVDWSLETIIGDRFEDALSARLAAGTDLPDMIFHRFGNSRLLEVYNTGLILGLNELIDEYGPNVKKNMETVMPYLTIANGTADGTILRVPQVVANIQHQVTTLNVRYDWLKECGLEVPTTPEEFKNMLVTFNEKNVNGSGNIVFLANYGNMNFSVGPAFGVMNATGASNSWWYDDDMKLYNSMLTDNMKEYVTWVNDLFAAGLIFPAFTNYTADQWNEVIYANKAGASVGAWWDGVIQNGTLASKGIEGEPIPIRNLQNKDGKSINVLKNLGGYGGFMITKDCARPDKAMEVINYGYTLEGSRLDYNGEIYPGGDYYVAVDESKLDDRLKGTLAEGQMEYTEKGQALMAENPQAWNMMGWNTATLGQWLIGTAGDIAKEFADVFFAAGLAADIDYNLDNLNFFIKEGVTQIGFAMPTDEQAAKIQEFDDLFTYMEENIQNFMIGARNISEWDAFVEECKNMGIDDATAIYQERFDAYVSIMDEMGAVVFEK
mgnify:CR=1 FL=1